MSSRGARARNGHVTTDEYKTVREFLSGAKELIGQGNIHSLPDYSHTPNRVYVKSNPDGSFREMRVYGNDQKVIYEIARHPEPNINNGDRTTPVWHYHEYDSELHRGPAHLLSERADLIEKYKVNLKEVGYDKW